MSKEGDRRSRKKWKKTFFENCFQKKTHPQRQVELGSPHVPGGPRHWHARDREEGPAKGDLRPADAEHLAAGDVRVCV